MDYKKRINELELRLFTLEKNYSLIEKRMNQLKESIDFHYEEIDKEQEEFDREHLLNTKEACEILNITETKLNEWVQKNLIVVRKIGNESYYDREELRTQFRKMRVNNG
jgi:hypothetical protein